MSSTSTDTDSSVIFIGTSKNLKTTAEVHTEQERFGKDFVMETPPRNQTGKRRTILQTNFVPDTQEQQGTHNTGKFILKNYLQMAKWIIIKSLHLTKQMSSIKPEMEQKR